MALTEKATAENAEAIYSSIEDAIGALTQAKVALIRARDLVRGEDTENLNAESIISLRGAADMLQNGLIDEATRWRGYARNRRNDK